MEHEKKRAVKNEGRYLFESMVSPERWIERYYVLAKLYGIPAKAPAESRVLEIGCGSGLNLIAQASRLPQANFVGLDIDAGQIEKANAYKEELQLSNCNFHNMSVEEAEFSESFDYIICHGLFAWVPQKTQQAIIALCHQYCAENGVIYISYNALPGWFLRGVISDHLRRADNAQAPIELRISNARGLLDEMRNELGFDVGTEDQERVKRELENCSAHSDAFVMHELLNPATRGFHFRQFMALLEEAGFQYLAEALPGRMREWRYDEMSEEIDLAEVRNKNASLVEKEQQMDHLFPQSFRGTLLVKGHHKRRDVADMSVVWDWYVSTHLVPLSEKPDLVSNKEEIFCASSNVSTEVGAPILKAAFVRLRERWPSALHAEELFEHALHLSGAEDAKETRRYLAAELVRYFLANMVDFHSNELRCSHVLTEKPFVHAYARCHAGRGDWVVTERHEYYVMNPFEALLLPLCDGTHTVAELVEKMTERVVDTDLTPKVDGKPIEDSGEVESLVAEHVKTTLEVFAERGLLAQSE